MYFRVQGRAILDPFLPLLLLPLSFLKFSFTASIIHCTRLIPSFLLCLFLHLCPSPFPSFSFSLPLFLLSVLTFLPFFLSSSFFPTQELIALLRNYCNPHISQRCDLPVADSFDVIKHKHTPH